MQLILIEAVLIEKRFVTKTGVILVLEKPGEEDLTRVREMMTAEKKMMIKIKGFIALNVYSWDILKQAVLCQKKK